MVQKETNNKNKMDTSTIAILPFNTAQYWIFKNGKENGLTANDLVEIDTLLKNCIADYNLPQEKKFREANHKHTEYKFKKNSFVIDLARYKRQYVAILNAKGEKEVWINCFCNALGKNWKTEIIDVEDGGNCYFNLKINLTTGLYYELVVNGNA